MLHKYRKNVVWWGYATMVGWPEGHVQVRSRVEDVANQLFLSPQKLLLFEKEYQLFLSPQKLLLFEKEYKKNRKMLTK
jgi:hypothetical protein